MGSILYLRLPWVVGQAGVLGAICTFVAAGSAVFMTVLSISAISTNGVVQGGGAYYMISRALGCEFGGAVGLLFWAANSTGIAFYIISFYEGVLQGVAPGNPLLWTSSTLFALLLLSLAGAKYFSKANALVFTAMMVSVVAACVAMFMGNSRPEGFTGMSWSTLQKNLWVDYVPTSDGTAMNFFSVLIISFPAMTGVLAGSNMSGDLKDPSKSIGRGTLIALSFALCVYFVLMALVGACVDRTVLQHNYLIFKDVTSPSWIISMGLACSTISSALSNLTGAARVLQALARDNLFPVLGPFKWGTKKGDEPLRGVLLTWLVAQCFLFAKSLDAIATITSCIFLVVYALTNFACFALRVSGAPNFRPKFRYFTWHTALAGFLGCCVLLFMSNPVYAVVSLLLLLAVMVYINWTAPATQLHDVSQALIFHQVRKYLLRLDERKAHAKFWRPSIVALIQDPSAVGSLALIDALNNLKKGGLFILGSILVGPLSERLTRLPVLRGAWLDFIQRFKIKAFPEFGVAPTARVALHNLVLNAGLGGMKANLVVLPMPPSKVLAAASVAIAGAATRSPALTPAPSDGSAAGSAAWKTRTEAAGPAAARIRDLYAQPGRGASYIDTVLHGRGPEPAGSLEDRQTTLLAQRGGGGDRRMVQAASLADAEGNMARETSLMLDAVEKRGAGASDDRQLDSSSDSGENDSQPGDSVALEMSSKLPGIRGASTLTREAGARGLAAMDQVDSFQWPFEDAREWLRTLHDVLALQKHLLVPAHFERLNKDLIVSAANRAAPKRRGLACWGSSAAKSSALASMDERDSQMCVDVWLTASQPWSTQSDVALALQLAEVLHRTDVWQRYTRVRIMSIAVEDADVQVEYERLRTVLQRYRFTGDVQVLSARTARSGRAVADAFKANPGDPTALLRDAAAVNEIIRAYTEYTVACFIALPPLPSIASINAPNAEAANAACGQFLATASTLVEGLPPTVLVRSAHTEDFVTDEL